MISSRSSKDLGHLSVPPTAASTHLSKARQFTGLLQRPTQSLCSLIRLARQRHLFPVTVYAAAVASVAVTAATLVVMQHMHDVPVQALAPAPAIPGAASTAAVKAHPKHHLLATLAANNPLRGIASWYGSVLHGHTTASGEVFDETEMTACHRTLPFGTVVRVTDTDSSRSVVVRINDRGVLNADRVIDLSAAAANKLGMLRSGLAHVKLEVLQATKPAPQTEAMEAN